MYDNIHMFILFWFDRMLSECLLYSGYIFSMLEKSKF